MKINYLSDLHLEFEFEKITDYADLGKDADVIVIAGDLSAAPYIEKELYTLAQLVSPCPLIYVTGNHDYYLGVKEEVNEALAALAEEHENLFVLHRQHIVIDNVVFIGTTGWQNRENYNEYYFFMVNDFDRIKNHNNDVGEYGKKDREYLTEQLLDKDWGSKKRVVVTHIPPSSMAINWDSEETIKHHADCIEAYYNNWDILAAQADLWICGHCHDSVDVIKNKKRIVRNALGYKKYIRHNAEFDKHKIVEI